MIVVSWAMGMMQIVEPALLRKWLAPRARETRVQRRFMSFRSLEFGMAMFAQLHIKFVPE